MEFTRPYEIHETLLAFWAFIIAIVVFLFVKRVLCRWSILLHVVTVRCRVDISKCLHELVEELLLEVDFLERFRVLHFEVLLLDVFELLFDNIFYNKILLCHFEECVCGDLFTKALLKIAEEWGAFSIQILCRMRIQDVCFNLHLQREG